MLTKIIGRDALVKTVMMMMMIWALGRRNKEVIWRPFVKTVSSSVGVIDCSHYDRYRPETSRAGLLY